MIVYVESNYLLEMTYLQEEHSSCEQLLTLAESSRIQLLLPASSIPEVRASLRGKLHRRREFYDRLRIEFRELSRSKPYEDLSRTVQPITAALIDLIENDEKRLDALLSRIFKVCEIIPVQGATVQRAIGDETRIGLSSQDAVILA
jgi:predicted nucleic acid-binding protein